MQPTFPWVNPETGDEMSFQQIVVAVLIEEHGQTKENAERLIKEHVQIMMSGMMGGMDYRATASALEIKELCLGDPHGN